MVEQDEHGPLSTDELLPLVKAIDTSRSSRRTKEIAQDIVDLSVFENDDLLSLLQGINAGLLFSSHVNSRNTSGVDHSQQILAGQVVLNEICRIFRERGITYKRLVPLENPGEAMEQLGKELQVFRLTQFHLPQPIITPDISYIYDQINGTYSSKNIQHLSSEQTSGIFTPIRPDRNLNLNPNYSYHVALFDTIIRPPDISLDHLREFMPKLKRPETIYQRMLDVHNHPTRGLPDPLTSQHANVSIQDILSEPNHDKSLRMTMRLASNVPQGDVFWQKTLQELFFNIMALSTMPTKDDFEHPDVIEKVYTQQTLLADNILKPALTSEDVPHHFDREFRKMLESLDAEAIRHVATSVATVFVTSPHIRYVFNPTTSFAEWVNLYPALSKAGEKAHSYPKAMLSDLISSAPWDYLRENMDIIERNFISRFGISKGTKEFIDMFKSSFSRSGRKELQLEAVRQGLKQEIDIDQVREARENASLIHTPDIRPRFFLGDNIEGEFEAHVHIDENSLAGQLGFEQIEIFPNQGPNGSTAFRILDNLPLTIVGYYSKTGEIFFENVASSQGSDDPLLQTVQQMVISLIEDVMTLEGSQNFEEFTGKTPVQLVENAKLRMNYRTPADTEKAALAFYRRTGSLTFSALEDAGEDLLIRAIKTHFPTISGLRSKLDERLNTTYSTEQADNVIEQLLANVTIDKEKE